MPEMTVKLRSMPDTAACVGWAGAHAVVVDRPAGKAGGQGLGFNGGELLGLAIGGCLCNDLHYVAAAMGIRLLAVSVDVTVRWAASRCWRPRPPSRSPSSRRSSGRGRRGPDPRGRGDLDREQLDHPRHTRPARLTAWVGAVTGGAPAPALQLSQHSHRLPSCATSA